LIIIAPTGDHQYSSRRRAIFDHHRADGRSSITIAPTGNHQSPLRRRAISISYCADGQSSIIHNLLADGQSSLIIKPTGAHSQPSRQAIRCRSASPHLIVASCAICQGKGRFGQLLHNHKPNRAGQHRFVFSGPWTYGGTRVQHFQERGRWDNRASCDKVAPSKFLHTA
jgi:hypothetical protein